MWHSRPGNGGCGRPLVATVTQWTWPLRSAAQSRPVAGPPDYCYAGSKPDRFFKLMKRLRDHQRSRLSVHIDGFAFR